ncbi:glycoside hydrolase superfamily [Lasiosphaeria ovina]|uniref:Glycoside hydrolase superfamily n=1 Tax=Lasiosphaeria ovina TaxID=92902 RepID=A0AAE0KIC2_9PEZI|nr:glycoside hydrolase superfamily [Lasiosphaeria ovina]
MKLNAAIAALAGLAAAAPSAEPDQHSRTPLLAGRADWPNGPLVTSGRWVHDASGKNVTYAGANWPGAADVMIPEGLQYQSIATIVSKVKSIGMNAIRLTFAIQMVDEIYANGGKDVTLEKAFAQALGQANGAKVLAQVLAKNPTFTAATTRLQVYDAVAAELAKQQIYVHLDNHISKGMWCCSTDDGNSWWGDKYFSAANWTRGLAYMADHAKAWPGFVSIGLRNEPREPSSKGQSAAYNWQTWYEYMKQGAAAVHAANPDPLIFMSGLSFDTFLTPVVQGTALSPGSGKFSFGDFAGYANKLVLEIHNYDNSATSCSSLQNNLYRNGFQALTASAANVFPVMMTEFGFQMDATTWKGVYASCLAAYLPAQKAGWTIWVLAGSYYIRSGRQDYDENWGLLNHDWSAWRSPSYIDGALTAMVKNTLS